MFKKVSFKKRKLSPKKQFRRRTFNNDDDDDNPPPKVAKLDKQAPSIKKYEISKDNIEPFFENARDWLCQMTQSRTSITLENKQIGFRLLSEIYAWFTQREFNNYNVDDLIKACVKHNIFDFTLSFFNTIEDFEDMEKQDRKNLLCGLKFLASTYNITPNSVPEWRTRYLDCCKIVLKVKDRKFTLDFFGDFQYCFFNVQECIKKSMKTTPFQLHELEREQQEFQSFFKSCQSILTKSILESKNQNRELDSSLIRCSLTINKVRLLHLLKLDIGRDMVTDLKLLESNLVRKSKDSIYESVQTCLLIKVLLNRFKTILLDNITNKAICFDFTQIGNFTDSLWHNIRYIYKVETYSDLFKEAFICHTYFKQFVRIDQNNYLFELNKLKDMLKTLDQHKIKIQQNSRQNNSGLYYFSLKINRCFTNKVELEKNRDFNEMKYYWGRVYTQ